MVPFTPAAGGWQADLPDRRDWTRDHESVAPLLQQLDAAGRLPPRVDLREFCAPVDDPLGLPASSAHACLGVLQYFERRSSGRTISPSRLFVYQASRRLAEPQENVTVDLRTTWKAIRRFGAPPERVWPYEPANVATPPDPYAFAYQEDHRELAYFRLKGETAGETLGWVRAFLAAGFAAAFGFTVHDSLTQAADIAFPTLYDAPRGAQAVAAVGYDDQRRIRSDKGALLIRASWGSAWGEGGYGWLPYAYVREQLAFDFWTIAKPQWLQSGEFNAPRTPAQ